MFDSMMETRWMFEDDAEALSQSALQLLHRATVEDLTMIDEIEDDLFEFGWSSGVTPRSTLRA